MCPFDRISGQKPCIRQVRRHSGYQQQGKYFDEAPCRIRNALRLSATNAQAEVPLLRFKDSFARPAPIVCANYL